VAARSVTQPGRDIPGTPLPRNIGRPATAALTLAGYHTLESLDGASAQELLRLHGVGPAAIARLREALAATGRSFRD
jgi:DNA repair protein RadC